MVEMDDLADGAAQVLLERYHSEQRVDGMTMCGIEVVKIEGGVLAHGWNTPYARWPSKAEAPISPECRSRWRRRHPGVGG